MSQVSKYPVSKEIYERIFDLLLETITKLNTKNQVSSFFDEFLTPTEHVMFAKRLAIGLLLAKNYKYREISTILRVSKGTIGTIAIRYRYGKAVKNAVVHILRSEQMEAFWLGVAEVLSSIGSVGTKGTKGTKVWRYLDAEIKKKRLNNPF